MRTGSPNTNCRTQIICSISQPTRCGKTPQFKIQNSQFDSLWLDGFAEMTPQELDLLAAILPFCENATLAFCLDESGEKENSWLSIWNVVGKSFQQCRQRIENLPDAKIEIEILPRDSEKTVSQKIPNLHGSKQTGQQPTQNPKLKTQNSVRDRFLRKRRSRGRFRRARNFEICPRPETVSAIAPCSSAIWTLITSRSRANFAATESRFFSTAANPSRITRSPNSRAARCAPSFSTGGKTIGLPRSRPDFVRRTKLKLTGWKMPRWNSAGAAKNGASRCRMKIVNGLRQKILPPFENFSAQLARLKFQPNGVQLAEILRELWERFESRTAALENWS